MNFILVSLNKDVKMEDDTIADQQIISTEENPEKR